MKLTILDQPPEGLLDREPRDLHEILDGPTLIRVEGEAGPPLFVSTLLHGNETTGYMALRRILREREEEGTMLPRTLWIFLGNIPAARKGLRRLPGQPDFNRIWLGGSREEHRVAAEVVGFVEKTAPLACIDIHNTTGKNPHYACVNTLKPEILGLAGRFSDTIVYFLNPPQVMSNVLHRIVPAITVEAGRPGEAAGEEHVYGFLSECLKAPDLASVPEGKRLPETVFHSMARIFVPDQYTIGFGGVDEDKEFDFRFIPKLDSLNFTFVEPGTEICRVREDEDARLIVVDEKGRDVGENYFAYENGAVRTRRRFIPCMLTRDVTVIRQDCLGYVMESYPVGRGDIPQ